MIRLLRVWIPFRVFGLFTSESALLFSCFLLAAYWLIEDDVQTYLTAGGGFARIGIVAGGFLLMAYFFDAYSSVKVKSTILLIAQVLLLIGAVLFIEGAVGYADPYWALPNSVSVGGAAAAIVVLSAWRLIYSKTLVSRRKTVLFVGDGPMVFRLSRQFEDRPEIGMRPIGYLSDVAAETTLLPYVGRIADVSSVVTELKPDRVVLACADRRGQLPIHDLLELRLAGFSFCEAASVYEEAFGRVSVDELRPSNLILSTHPGTGRGTVRLQTIHSFVVALIGLIVSAPVLVLAALLIKLTSRGPIFYRQTRIGLNGKPFDMFKLRSMGQNAEAGTGAVWASRNDARVTPVGRFLRKTRIDEIPQFWNVLRGEMAIVGPRPERPEFVRQLTMLIPFYSQRHAVKPGITGWAQINHQYGDSTEHATTKLEYDLYYIKNFSPVLDLYIMLQTVKIMLLSKGAQ